MVLPHTKHVVKSDWHCQHSGRGHGISAGDQTFPLGQVCSRD